MGVVSHNGYAREGFDMKRSPRRMLKYSPRLPCNENAARFSLEVEGVYPPFFYFLEQEAFQDENTKRIIGSLSQLPCGGVDRLLVGVSPRLELLTCW